MLRINDQITIESIKDLEKIESVDVRNSLFARVEKGFLFFQVPERITEKKEKIIYRFGFIYETIRFFHPTMKRKDVFHIVNESYYYHLTYKQSSNIMNLYYEKGFPKRD